MLSDEANLISLRNRWCQDFLETAIVGFRICWEFVRLGTKLSRVVALRYECFQLLALKCHYVGESKDEKMKISMALTDVKQINKKGQGKHLTVR